MLKNDKIGEINSLTKEGFSISAISQKVKVSLPTVYKYLKKNDISGIVPNNDSFLLEFQNYIKKRKREGVTNKFKIYNEISNLGYKGSYSTVYRFLKSLKKKRTVYPVIRFETKPGEQAQVDWGYVCKIKLDGKPERLYFFVYELGYSRQMYVEFTIKQNLQTLEECHINAFEKLGITKTILYDNMKTVIIRREKSKDNQIAVIYNPAFLDFSQHYGFEIKLCRPYWPRTKGKVERGVGYVKINFLQGLKIPTNCKSLTDINFLATKWSDEIANSRVHGTTKEIPQNRWLKERNYLNFARDFSPHITSPTSVRRSTGDCMVLYKWNYYEVPGFPRRKLFLKEINENGLVNLEIYNNFNLIQKYRLCNTKGEWILAENSLIIKPKAKQKRALQDKKSEPIVKSRPLSYYDQFIPNYFYGKES